MDFTTQNQHQIEQSAKQIEETFDKVKTFLNTCNQDDIHPIQNILSAELKSGTDGRLKNANISSDILSNIISGSQTDNQVESSTSTSRKLTCNRQLFLCSPDFLQLKYVINPWMDLSAQFSVEKAKQQWEELVNTYKKLVPESVHTVPPKENLTELCFFGDSVFAINKKAVFGRFATNERFPETEYVIEYLRSQGFEGERVPEGMHYEGSGETMVWNGKILVGYGKRNTKEIVSYLQKVYSNMEVIGFQLIDPEFYHLDTAMFPISENLIAVYENAFSEEAKQKIKKLGCEIIYLTYKDAKEFSCNSTVIGKHAIVHYEAENFIKLLQQRGFQIHTVDVSEFIKFGGGLKCLTFQHYLI
ncbi:hypothetical protein ABPG72_016207 [Tetrahymena utriculariae]